MYFLAWWTPLRTDGYSQSRRRGSLIVDLVLNESYHTVVQTARQEPHSARGQSQSHRHKDEDGRSHLKGLVRFHLHEFLLLAVVVPSAMSIVVGVSNMLVRLKKPLRHPSCLLATRGVEVIATGSVTEIDQEKREEENRDVDGRHDKLKNDIHVSIIMTNIQSYLAHLSSR